MTRGHTHGFPWPLWEWFLEAHYSDLGPVECARQLSDLAGVELTHSAVEQKARKLDKCVNPEVMVRIRQAAIIKRGDRPARIVKGNGSRRARWCPGCKAWGPPEGDDCPVCGASRKAFGAVAM